ncbi:hypothetical protein OUZ56_029867 [Daphnia magna]|uniref:Uncharacterized protein n=1 Tax=Daphnia magna TaxID=35525 RepID=A0ABR0B836_9CRUS|nr:hypothetical protein OUZ56_029867 [Daphnia magna]
MLEVGSLNRCTTLPKKIKPITAKPINFRHRKSIKFIIRPTVALKHGKEKSKLKLMISQCIHIEYQSKNSRTTSFYTGFMKVELQEN